MADEEKVSALDQLREAHANGQLHPAILPALLELTGHADQEPADEETPTEGSKPAAAGKGGTKK